nr:response regulator [uncultured Nocardioides sp.]
MNPTTISILVVDDNEAVGADLVTLLTRELKDLDPSIKRVTSFDEGEGLLKEQGFDLAILDVRFDGDLTGDNQAGRRVFERVSKAQWLPVVFWTAAPSEVEDLAAPPLVQVANKTQILEIPQLVRDALASGVPQFARQVASEMETLARGFLRDLVSSQWDSMKEVERDDVLPLLANRLSFYLRNGFLDELHLRGASEGLHDHPSAARCYLMPPVTEALTTGDLYSHGDDWWVLVTPQCDMEVRAKTGHMKAEYLRLLKAVAPESTRAAKEYLAAEGRGKQKDALRKVTDILGDDHRFFYLPAYLKVPHLVIDFEQSLTVPRDDLLPPATLPMDAPVDEPVTVEQDASEATQATGVSPTAHRTQTAEAAAGSGTCQETETAGTTGTTGKVPWTRVATIDAPYSQALLYRLSRAVARIGIEDIPPDAVVGILDSKRDMVTARSQAG